MLEFRMDFEMISEIRLPVTIARGAGMRESPRLRKIHGPTNWRMREGYATVRLSDGSIREAEIHGYEAAGVGRREFKIKRNTDTRP